MTVAPNQINRNVSVVIVTFDVLPKLRRCLESIPAAVAGLRTEVVVVDNGYGDGTWAWLADSKTHGPFAVHRPWDLALRLTSTRKRHGAVRSDTESRYGASA